jgi:hypothetical protein
MTETPETPSQDQPLTRPVSVRVNFSGADETYTPPSLIPELRPVGLCLCKCGSATGGGSGES